MHFSKVIVKNICNRREGIGADGVILLENGCDKPFKMRIFNSDGTEAEMCGNGLRALTKFLVEMGIEKETYEIETIEGKIYTTFLEGEDVAIKMADASDFEWNINFEEKTLHFLNTGVPHAVIFLKDIEELEFQKMGSYIRHHQKFAPKGTNVNFVKIENKQTISVRTFERGVEAETLACGTGSVASAITAAKIYQLKSPICVKVRSGSQLKVCFNEHFNDVLLMGPAKKIFSGTLML